MAFDNATRKRLNNFVGEARDLITEEFRQQFQSLYGISAAGKITSLEALGHLDEAGLATASLLRARIEYLIRSHPAAGDVERAAVERLAREQAFTVLNRLAALRMAEKRGLTVESVGRGYQSRGFQVFGRVAGAGLGESYTRYRRYLFCLFDELAVDLGVLFDRRLPQALIFPRESALLEVLGLLNAPDLETLWSEDETIGWIYQYYNDPEERAQMRDKKRGGSDAPRNSRELAVRNQFFTPRYVVEFLTDNTLGRLWYEMRKGQTVLNDVCRYLVRHPSEVFLEPDESAPENSADHKAARENAGQGELLRRTAYIPERRLKDPRLIRMLDPACGSMHFGLYAFDLFTVIYDEAWEIVHGPDDVVKCAETFAPFVTFAMGFPDKAAFLREVPRLIIEYNIHGIDIDPRAAQIAGLSLWLRAQRAWHQADVQPAARPRITRSNLVCAEPMPGEEGQLAAFCDSLQQPAIGQLVRVIFEKMKLAGEAGSLLRIEEEIRALVHDTKLRWAETYRFEQLPTEFFTKAEMTAFSRPKKHNGPELAIDFSGITDEAFWDKAEQRIYDTLKAFAEHAEKDGGLHRRLFADDMVRGFAFIDVCRKRFEVVVMNPPFGSPPDSVASMLPPDAAGNIYPAFVLRGAELCDGFVGAITDRTFVVQQSFGDFRNRLISDLGVIALAELGWGVLDGADVQVATYFVRKGPEPVHLFASASGAENDPAGWLQRVIAEFSWTALSADLIRKLPSSAFAHTLPAAYLSHLEAQSSLRELAALPRGLGSNNANRTYKAWYEVPIGSIGEGRDYRSLSNGGPASPFYRDDAGVAEWLRRDGKLLIEEGYSENHKAYDQKSNPLYFSPGLSFPKQATSFNVSALPEDAIPTREGKGIVPNLAEDRLVLLAYLNSAYARFFVEATNGLHKQSGPVGMTPVPHFSSATRAALSSAAIEGWRTIATSYLFDEAARVFVRPALAVDSQGLGDCDLSAILRAIDVIVFDEVGVEKHDRETLTAQPRPATTFFKPAQTDALNYALGCVFGRWDIRRAKNDRSKLELPDPFAPLPASPPGMLLGAGGLPLSPEDGRQLRLKGLYPLEVAWEGILVDDPEHSLDLERCVHAALKLIWSDHTDDNEREVCALLGVPTLSEWFRRPTGFFADHLKRYSKSRRQAPIYWPLSTASGSYTLWLYYHRLSDQTLHSCLADFIDPKVKAVETEISLLREKKLTGKVAEKQEFLDELRDLRTEIEQLIKLPWRPNLNDGVLITAAPLWKLFRHSKWQKDLKTCWEELQAGDYDWAHLAYSIWPQRVTEQCKTDRSLAIAHGLEDICEVEAPKLKKAKSSKKSKSADEADELALEQGDAKRTRATPKISTPRPSTSSSRAPARDSGAEPPLPIEDTDRDDVMCVIRQVFSRGGAQEREEALKQISEALGYQRLGTKIREILENDLLAAVRRGILTNEEGMLSLTAGDIRDFARDSLKDDFLTALGRTWKDREEAIRNFARFLGYARTGPTIEETARSLINGLIRECRIENDGDRIRRRA